MKLYNRQGFLALPAGVVFAKYEPNCFGEWKIKGESRTNDFHYQPFLDLGGEDQELWEAYEELDKTGSAKVDFYSDGLFETVCCVRSRIGAWVSVTSRKYLVGRLWHK